MATLFDFGFISTPDGCLRLQSLFFATFVKSKRQKYFPPVLLFFSVVLKACDYIRRLLPGTHAFLSINIAYCMCSTSILADIEVSFGCHSFISVKKMQKENGIFFFGWSNLNFDWFLIFLPLKRVHLTLLCSYCFVFLVLLPHFMATFHIKTSLKVFFLLLFYSFLGLKNLHENPWFYHAYDENVHGQYVLPNWSHRVLYESLHLHKIPVLHLFSRQKRR